MIEIETDFPWLGARDYIHGTSILSRFLDALEARGHTGIAVKRIKFQRPASSNGVLTLTTGALDETRMENANCTFQGSAGGSSWRGVFEERGAAVAQRIDVTYPIENVEAHAFGGSCTLAASGRDDLIRAFVEANKRFHERSVGSARAVRFGYLESWTPPPADVRLAGALTAKNLIARRTSDGYMTINRLEYAPEAGTPTSLTLCFNLKLSEAA
jgi:hypothetical protein